MDSTFIVNKSTNKLHTKADEYTTNNKWTILLNNDDGE